MPDLEIRFGELEDGWVELLIGQDGQQKVECDASDIASSFDLLIAALFSLWKGEGEATVSWLLEPSELDLIFSRRDEFICLEVVRFPGSFRPASRATLTIEPVFAFTGSYQQTCLPFWHALRELEGRYSREELAERWTWPFPHEELALLTRKLGKD